MQAGFSAGCCIILFNVRRKVEVEGNVELITPLLCRSFGSVLQQGMLVRLVQIQADLSLFHREYLICGQSSDATERKGELHGLGHIRNILRVDIGTPAVIAANAHLLTHSTNDRVMDRGQLVGVLGTLLCCALQTGILITQVAQISCVSSENIIESK